MEEINVTTLPAETALTSGQVSAVCKTTRVTQEDSNVVKTSKILKKVAAGKAGALARRTKKEALESELRKYKASLHAAPDGEDHAEHFADGPHPSSGPHLADGMQTAPRPDTEKRQAKADYTWLPFGIAGVTLVDTLVRRTLCL